MKIQCPAKVNLFLEVTGKRPDGYHRLAMLFAKINLYDVLEFKPHHGQILLSVECDKGLGTLSNGADNLVHRAAQGFCRAFGVTQGVHLHLTKRIPMGAGLGGGSSDAAGTLLGLCRFFDMKIDSDQRKDLARLAVRLGADVPFFLHPAPFCEARGIGERLKAVAVHKSLPYMVLVYPGFGVSTTAAFKALQKPGRSDVLTRLSQLDKLTKSLKKGKPLAEWQACLFNRLEQTTLPILSQVNCVRRVLLRLGLQGVLMTGSGSAVFGFVSSYAEGERVVNRLAGYPWKVFLTCTNG